MIVEKLRCVDGRIRPTDSDDENSFDHALVLGGTLSALIIAFVAQQPLERTTGISILVSSDS